MEREETPIIGKIVDISEIDGKIPDQKEEERWKIEIVKVHNGYIIKETDFESDKRIITTLIEEKDILGKDYVEYQPTKGDRDAMTELLYLIADFFGFDYDKWGKHNLRISFNKKGHKVD